MPDTNGHNNGTGVALLQKARGGFTLWRTWAEIDPEARFGFPFRMYLSEEYANKREAMIGATPEEKGKLFRNFKTEVVADALADVPIGVTDFPPPAPLPPEASPAQKRADLRRRALEFFDARDDEGNQILWFMVETLFREYWERALPDNFSPAGKDTNAPIALPQPPIGGIGGS